MIGFYDDKKVNNWREKFKRLVRNPWLDLVVGLTLAISGFWEMWTTFPSDIHDFQLGVHHGAFLLGVVTLLRSFAAIFAGLEFVDEADYQKKQEDSKKTVN